jgi:glutamate carboxypeptidase
MYTLEVEGLSAHAGVEPEMGHSAILEMAHRIVALHALNGTIEGVTVNVGVVHGGERANIVPDHATAQIDVRAPSARAVAAIEEALRRACDTATVPGTTLRLSGRFAHQPFEQSPASKALFEDARVVGRELGMELRGKSTGGGSDGNTTAAAGVATLDGMGPSGGLAHNPGEWISVDSIAPRVALLAGLLRRRGGVAE